MPSGAERRAPFWALLGLTLVLDRITKIVAERALGGGNVIPVFGDSARFSLVHNQGAAFGLGTHLGSASRWIFLAIAILAVPVLYRLWQQAPLADRMRQFALGFVAGGAVGNGIDRILSSRGVTDFIDVGIGAMRWPTFNVADIAVSCGAVVLALTLWREDARRVEGEVPVSFSVVPLTTERLDRFLADQLQLSRTQAAQFVAAGQVTVNGVVARASRTLKRGETVVVTPSETQAPRVFRPLDIALSIIYEDDDLLVIDKPAGLVVHPAPGHWDDTLVNALAARGTALSGGTDGRPGIVHRLDRDTSGLLIVAKNELAHRKLSAAIAARQVHRIYAVMIWGHLDEEKIRIDSPIGRHPKDRKRMTLTEEGRAARTDAFPIVRLGPVQLARMELHTGRTHQIRVHLESIGHPVVGDTVYAGGGARRISGVGKDVARTLEALAPRQALHAAMLAFRHPITNQPLELLAPWPMDLWPLLKTALGEDAPAEAEGVLQYLNFFTTNA